jgi:probable HAF family extracellular repeat protein
MAELAAGSDAIAINEAVEITGRSYSSNFQFDHAFLWSKGKMIDLGVLPNGTTSEANGINAWGQVVGLVGLSSSTDPLSVAFLYSDGKMRNLNDRIRLIPVGFCPTQLESTIADRSPAPVT